MHNKSTLLPPITYGLIVFVLLFIFTQYFSFLQYKLWKELEYDELQKESGRVKDLFRSVLYDDIAAASAMAIISREYGIPPNYDSIAKQIISNSKYVEAIQIIRGGIIVNVYPNEYKETIGINTLTDPMRTEETNEAIKKTFYFAGPRKLRLGGTGILGKVPVIANNEVQGFVVVLTKMETIQKLLEPYSERNTYSYTLQKGSEDSIRFALSNNMPSPHRETVSVHIPEGDWQLHVAYSTVAPPVNTYIISALGFLLSLFAAAYVYTRAKATSKLEKLVNAKTYELGERVKELSTIYDVNEFLKDDTQSVNEVFTRIVNRLPAGWQYPEICCARITLDEEAFTTANFMETPYRQSAPFTLQDGRQGNIEVIYLQKKPEAGEGPFLQEERDMINALAETIQVYFNKKINKDELARSEARFRSAFEDAAIGMALTSLDGRWLRVNAALCDMLGYTSAELESATFMAVTHPEDIANDIDAVKGLVQGEKKYYRADKRYMHKDGSVVWINLNVAMVKDENNIPQYFVAQIKNINETIETQLKFQNLVEKSLVGVYIIQNGRFVYVNPKVVEESGYSEGELLTMSVNDIIYEEDLPFLDANISQRLGGTMPAAKYEIRVKRKDGNVLWTELYGTSTPYRGKPAIIGTIINVTDRKKLELEREQIIGDLLQRNKELEQFNHVLSHNVRAPLATILGLCNIVDGEGADEERAAILAGITESACRLDDIISDLNEILNTKKVLSQRKTIIRFSEIVDEVKAILSSHIVASQAVVTTNFSAVESIKAVHAYMHSIFLNLISNSIKFARKDEAPHISIQSEKNGNTITLRFSDNAIGIDMDKHANDVFVLYKRFHTHTDGRGLGLFMTKQQVEAQNGHIGIQSKPGEGSTFTITFYE